MTTPTVPGRQLGRNPTDPARLARTVRLRLTGAVPAHPLVADHLSAVLNWMLGGNNRFGTCGPTYVANYCVLLWKYLLGEDITVTDDAVFDLYRRSGNPDFDPNGTPDASGNVPGDNGVDMTVMLSALVKGGIDITHADGTVENVKPLCFAAAPTDVDSVRAVTSIFGAAGLAVDLAVAQQGQTDAGVWDYVAGSGDWGGHAIPGGSYTSDAAARHTDETVVTWQMKVGTTDTFISHQLSEAYAVVFQPLWDHPAFQAGVDQAALAADYTAATGKPFPVPVPGPPSPGPTPAPPGPTPTPTPPPSPAPGDIHVDSADQALAAALPRGWVTEHHVGENGHAAKAVRAWLHAKSLS
jgi:hypothetical protein